MKIHKIENLWNFDSFPNYRNFRNLIIFENLKYEKFSEFLKLKIFGIFLNKNFWNSHS